MYNIKNRLFKLAMPIAFQQFMLALVSACDAFMLGGVNQDSLSAVSLASQITFVFNLILTALTIGENMFVAQYYGKEDLHGVRASAALVLKYVFFTSVIFWLVTLFAPEFLMRLFTNNGILITHGSRYLRFIGLSYIFSGTLQVLLGLLKNCEHVLKSTIISTIVVFVNIVLNGIFIYGMFGMPRMEIAGAALATVMANGIGLVIVCIHFLRDDKLRITGKELIAKKYNLTKKFWKHVFPVLLNEIAWGVVLPCIL